MVGTLDGPLLLLSNSFEHFALMGSGDAKTFLSRLSHLVKLSLPNIIPCYSYHYVAAIVLANGGERRLT